MLAKYTMFTICGILWGLSGEPNILFGSAVIFTLSCLDSIVNNKE